MSASAARVHRSGISWLLLCCALLGLCCALLGLPGCGATWVLDRKWVEVRSEHFTITSELDAEQTQELARALELFRAAVLVMTRTRSLDASIPTRVFFFDSPATFRPFQPGSSAILGYFRPTLRANFVAVLDHWSMSADEVLRHEYTHFLVRNGSARVYPLWYDEGFAELLSTAGIEGDYLAVGKIPIGRLRQIRSSPWIPVRRILAFDGSERWTQAQVAMFYAESWAILHYLSRDLEHAVALGPAIETYLDRIEAGDGPDDACLAAFGMSASDLDRELRHHVSSGTFTPIGVRTDRLEWKQETETRRLPRSETAERLGELSLAFGRTSQAELLFRAAIAENPDLARAHAGLADALASDEKWSAAEAEYARAIALAPDDPLNQLDFGEYWLMRARRSDDDAERKRCLSRSRKRLVAANQLNDALPEIYAVYGSTFLEDGEDPGRGLETLEHAIRLLPSNTDVQLMLAEGYVRLGRPDDALPLLDRILAWVHEGDSADRARALRERIEAPAGSAAGKGTGTGGDQTETRSSVPARRRMPSRMQMRSSRGVFADS